MMQVEPKYLGERCTMTCTGQKRRVEHEYLGTGLRCRGLVTHAFETQRICIIHARQLALEFMMEDA